LVSNVIFPDIPQEPAAVANHYDELDRFYREIWGEHVHHGYWQDGRESPRQAVEELIHLVARRLNLQERMEICDVGCGYGATSKFLSERYGVRATGLTLSQVQRDRALDDLDNELNVEILCADWLENSFPARQFDAVLSIESTEHMADKQKFFDEAFRTLRKGGRLGVYAWLSRPAPRKWEVDHLLEPICREGRLASMGSIEEYRAFASRSGFEIESFEDISRQVSKTWRLCIQRFLVKLCVDRSYSRYVFDRSRRERIFALTVFRILSAYRLGAMRYGLLIARKPQDRL
jgi:tocopherol O-methyltransferase